MSSSNSFSIQGDFVEIDFPTAIAVETVPAASSTLSAEIPCKIPKAQVKKVNLITTLLCSLLNQRSESSFILSMFARMSWPTLSWANLAILLIRFYETSSNREDFTFVYE
ncbi:hypothetical protein VNO80_19535 [Phaseolus coccineus]|uniref:Uncharacterized protein n=1 Tax=Phaseolus coccineus TaxID=3886 RepID=A0AAN9R4W2_PHACN